MFVPRFCGLCMFAISCVVSVCILLLMLQKLPCEGINKEYTAWLTFHHLKMGDLRSFWTQFRVSGDGNPKLGSTGI